MAKRVLLGKDGNNYVLKVSKPGVDVIDDTINNRDYLFNSEMYRAGVIRSNSTYTSITTSGVQLPTTSDANGNPYIPAYIVTEKGAMFPTGFFSQGRSYFSGFYDVYAKVVGALSTAGGGGLFQFSLNTGSDKNTVIPYYVELGDCSNPQPGENGGNYPYFKARARASGDGDVKIQILGIPCQYGKMITDTTLFGTSVLTGSNSGQGGSGSGGVAGPPTISAVTKTARNNSNDTVAVTAANGANQTGTITYAQASTNSVAGLTFQSSNSFAHPRGTTRYYFAKQGGLTSNTVQTNSAHTYTSPAVDSTPSGFNNLTATAASGSAGTATYTIAGLGDGDTASASASGSGSVSPTSGQNGTVLTFSLTATGGGGNTTSANITVGTVTRTFTVTTAIANTPTFNPSDFTDATTNIEPNATVTSNTITVGNINVGLSVSVSGCTVSIAGGSFGSGGTVTNGQTLQIRSTASSSFGTTTTPSITVGSTTINQTVTTRTAVTASAPTSMTATQSTNSNNNTETVTCSASGGSGTLQFSNDNSTWGTGTTFTQTRNTTVTYYARRTAEAGASSSISVYEFVPPLYNIGSFPDIANFSASGGTFSNPATSELSANLYLFSLTGYGSSSVSVAITSNPGSMLSNVSIASNGTVSGTVAANTGSARTATVTVSVTTSQGGTDSDSFDIVQAAPGSALWEVGITMGDGGGQGTGYSGLFNFFGTTTDTSCDLFTGTPAWRFYDLPSSSTNTFFYLNGLHANGGWTTLKIYNGTSASGTLLATISRSGLTYSQVSFISTTLWDLGADYTAASGNRYLVFT